MTKKSTSAPAKADPFRSAIRVRLSTHVTLAAAARLSQPRVTTSALADWILRAWLDRGNQDDQYPLHPEIDPKEKWVILAGGSGNKPRHA